MSTIELCDVNIKNPLRLRYHTLHPSLGGQLQNALISKILTLHVTLQVSSILVVWKASSCFVTCLFIVFWYCLTSKRKREGLLTIEHFTLFIDGLWWKNPSSHLTLEAAPQKTLFSACLLMCAKIHSMEDYIFFTSIWLFSSFFFFLLFSANTQVDAFEFGRLINNKPNQTSWRAGVTPLTLIWKVGSKKKKHSKNKYLHLSLSKK